MSEGQQFEIPPKTKEPQGVEALLERGEIEKVKELDGYWGMQLIKIKDDGDALFRRDDATSIWFEEEGLEVRRSDLELIAYKIDQILEFNLIPTVTNRTIGEYKGSLQRRISSFYDGHSVGWENNVRPEEITRAAIFDYLFDVRDRHNGNFIIDADTDKLWLIDHDFFMFFGEDFGAGARIVEKARMKGLVNLSGIEIASLERFLANVDTLMTDAKPKVAEIIQKACDRAKILLKQGQIPTTNI